MIKEYDTVKLKDGREGTIVDVLDAYNFIFEWVDDEKYQVDGITKDDVLEVLYTNK